MNQKQSPAIPEEALRDVRALRRALAAGADVNASVGHGFAPLHVSENPDVVAALIAAGADVGARSAHGTTPLHLRENPDCLRQLIEAGADVDALDDEGQVPLHYACLFGAVAAARVLIAAGANVNALSKDGKTPLMEVIEIPLARALLEAGADPDIRNPAGENVFDRLRQSGDSECRAMLELLNSWESWQRKDAIEASLGEDGEQCVPGI